MLNEDTIFARIVKKEIPAAIIHEDDEILAFLDIKPANKGHCLVIPKKGYVTFGDIPDDLLGRLFTVAKKVAQAVKEVTGCDGYNVLMNAGEAAGQVVMHAHVHIIPRFKIDSWNFSWPEEQYDTDELENLKADLLKHLG